MKKNYSQNTTLLTKGRRTAYALVLAVSLSASALTACQSQPAASTADYIGIDAAKEAALKAAGISADQASFSAAGLDSRDGIFYYQVIFTENGVEREYDIDAVTGVVIEEKILTAASAEETAAEGQTAAAPSSAEAQTAAGTSPAEAQTAAGTSPAEAQTAAGTSPASSIDEESALSAALEHAGVAREDIYRTRVNRDREDGLMVFEVEFTTADGTEYEYKINQADGSILSFSQDTHVPYTPSSGTEGLISEDTARQTILARVPGASAADISLFLDEDDGRLEYEGHLAYGDMFYEFKIDAYSGTVTEWEAEARRPRS